MKHKGSIKAIVIVCGFGLLTYLVLNYLGLHFSNRTVACHDGCETVVASALEAGARDCLWAVALTLTVGVALFNNAFKLFDKAEQIYKVRKSTIDKDAFSVAMALTTTLTGKLLENAKASIGCGIAMFILSVLRKIPTSLIPYYHVGSLHLDRVAIGAEIGLAVLIVLLLLNQFRTIPTFIELYRTLSEESIKDPPTEESTKDPPSPSVDDEACQTPPLVSTP